MNTVGRYELRDTTLQNTKVLNGLRHFRWIPQIKYTISKNQLIKCIFHMKVTECTSLLSKFDVIDLEEVDVRREGAQQVENVVATVIPDDT